MCNTAYCSWQIQQPVLLFTSRFLLETQKGQNAKNGAYNTEYVFAG